MMSQPSSTAEDKNWRNAGNWHWVTKDALPFAKQYLTTHISKVNLDHKGVRVNVCDVDTITGDCELNVRKGKLITIYDLTLTMKWESTGPADLKCKGTVTIPEISHDLLDDSDDDLVLTIAIDKDSHLKDPVRSVLREKLRAPILEILKAFPKQLIDSQSDGVYIENATPSVQLPGADLEERKRLAQSFDSTMSFADTFSVEQRMNKKPSSTPSQKTPTSNKSPMATTKPATSSKSGAGAKVERTVSMRCSVQDACACFQDLGRLQHWTQGQCALDSDVWSIFDGQVTAKLGSGSNGHVDLAHWRLSAWPAGVESHVVLKFSASDEGSDVHLMHTGLPSSEQPQVEQHWTQVFNRIKMTFGYGTFL